MSDTASLLFTQVLAQAALFIVAALLIVSAGRSIGKWAKASHAALEDDDEEAPRFPAVIVLFKGVLGALAVMALFSVNVWMPKADNTPPAVNDTIQSQIHRDADRPIEVKPVTPDTSNQDNETARESLIDDVRKDFEALPDDTE